MEEIIQRLERIEAILGADRAEYLDTEAAAAFLGVKPGTMEIWRCNGDGPAFLKVGRVVRYSRADLVTWIEAGRQKQLS